jgi:hypothetical protein
MLASMAGAQACGGETLSLGRNLRETDPSAEEDPIAKGCAAPPGKVVPTEASPMDKSRVARELLIGRWFACSVETLPPDVPSAIEFAGEGVYVLVAGADGDYRREERQEYGTAWSLSYDALVVTWGTSSTHASFEETPLRMRWREQGVVFVKD